MVRGLCNRSVLETCNAFFAGSGVHAHADALGPRAQPKKSKSKSLFG